ncbi:MAG: hypothetical protein ACTHJX_04915 [Terriglobales bacterium]
MSFSLAVWLVVCLADLAALAATFRRGLDRGLLWLRWYFALALASNITVHSVLLRYGFDAPQYAYAYYAGDLAIVVFGFFVLARLVELAFEKSSVKLPGLRLGAIVVFTGLAVCSALVVYLGRGGLSAAAYGREMEQNFSFLGMLMAVILFVGMNAIQVPGLRFRRVVLSFSVLYSSGAIAYSLESVLPNFMSFIGYFIVPVTSLAGIGLIAYSLWVPQPAEVAVREPKPTMVPDALREGAW